MIAVPKKNAQLERLPPTQAALKEAILHAHYQGMVWNSDKVPNPELPSPQPFMDGQWIKVCLYTHQFNFNLRFKVLNIMFI